VHHLIKASTDLKYTENVEKGTTVSTLDVELDLPFFLWPLKKWIRKTIERLKIQKDQEDIEMIRRRGQLFGRRNNAAYLVEHQFLLYKDHYVKHFGKNSEPPAP
jgi:hypothetical protein